MKRNLLTSISILPSLVLSILFTVTLLSGTTVFAQSAKPAPAPDLKVIRFGIERKSSTKLEIESVPAKNHHLRSTEIFTYRSELGNEPRAGNQYEQFNMRPIKSMFALLQVTNESAKTITSIEWEYTYPHFKGDKVISHLKTTSRLKIGSGQNATLSKQLPYEPDCGMIYVMARGQQAIGKTCGRKIRKETGVYPVEMRLRQINYEDGTVWKAQP
jgi:hypothetical protein